MILAAKDLIENDNDPFFSLGNDYYKHLRAILDVLHAMYSEEDKQPFLTLVMFLETSFQKDRTFSSLISVSLVFSVRMLSHE